MLRFILRELTMAMTAAERERHIEAWRKSGLSQSAFCRQRRLSPSTFSGWLRRSAPAEVTSPPPLIPIQIEPAPMAPVNEVLLLRLPRGGQLELPVTVSPRWLGEVLQCLG